MSQLTQGKSPFTGTALPRKDRPFWIIDGQAYDFSDWMNKHPAGPIWFKLTQGRDISVLFHVMHRDPMKLLDILKKYRIDDTTASDVLPKMGLPPFLLPKDFDAARDLPRFDFSSEDNLLRKIRNAVESRLGSKRLSYYDLAFDVLVVVLMLLHLSTLGALISGFLSPLVCGVIWVFTRTSLAGAGHYHIHRKEKPNALDALFDVNYVGTCLIGADGHVLLHHPHLGSDADVKRTFFDGMMCVHPAVRVLGYTLHKFGVCITGMLFRGGEVLFLENKDYTRLEFWFVRVWLLLELLACVFSGHFVFWSIQFVITLWYNTFLVVASHDFEREEGDAPLRQLSEKLRSDWAAQQIQLSYDLSVVGIRWLDVFLTAGLSPHRVHHVLPTQRSGFSNIASERIVREVCEEAGLVWHPPRNLWFDRFPAIFRRFLLAPAQRPESGVAKPANTVPWPVAETSVLCRYVVAGWKGVGAV